MPSSRSRTLGHPPTRRSVLVAAGGAGYLLGMLPSADIAARLAGGSRRGGGPPSEQSGPSRSPVDIRHEGSGNPGAMNVASVLGARWGAAVLIADMAKGAAAGACGQAIAGDDGAYLAATAAIAGHVAPVWNGFHGGKGVATSAGASLAVFPWYFPVDLAVTVFGVVRRGQAERATRLACGIWVVASFVAWRFRLRAGWGPEPSGGLVAFSVAGSAMVLGRFAQARRAATRPGDGAVGAL